MTDTLMIRGFVGNEPQSTTTSGGTPVLNFRVGSSQRRFDARTGEWIDMGTNWYSVSAYRQLANHARASLRKGDAVIVSGRLKLREWESAGGQRGASFDLDADAIGHDLRWGTSNFMKTPRAVTTNDGGQVTGTPHGEDAYDPEAPAQGQVAADDGAPFDQDQAPTDPWSQQLIDGATGEIRDASEVGAEDAVEDAA